MGYEEINPAEKEEETLERRPQNLILYFSLKDFDALERAAETDPLREWARAVLLKAAEEAQLKSV